MDRDNKPEIQNVYDQTSDRKLTEATQAHNAFETYWQSMSDHKPEGMDVAPSYHNAAHIEAFYKAVSALEGDQALYDLLGFSKDLEEFNQIHGLEGDEYLTKTDLLFSLKLAAGYHDQGNITPEVMIEEASNRADHYLADAQAEDRSIEIALADMDTLPLPENKLNSLKLLVSELIDRTKMDWAGTGSLTNRFGVGVQAIDQILQYVYVDQVMKGAESVSQSRNLQVAGLLNEIRVQKLLLAEQSAENRQPANPNWKLPLYDFMNFIPKRIQTIFGPKAEQFIAHLKIVQGGKAGTLAEIADFPNANIDATTIDRVIKTIYEHSHLSNQELAANLARVFPTETQKLIAQPRSAE